ncbi:4Fe-4S dicluster-binding protein [Desulfurobacterium indicum]|uniref:Ferredoxin n=1 Tax=Desulfurobacterium indicum TaxID=1914305 RepID=A0A1R1MNB3_9BACT|nr:4Fe-4S dicluster-binding protein [Desulfurobacterium indicum]OMH41312.1 ferredoxin [Desulfurobacterium indicum]
MKGWRDLEIGALITEPGNSAEYKTGEWRAWRPVFNRENCIDCMICWVFCPDSSIIVKDKKVVGIDYDHCKGCGICAHECPKSKGDDESKKALVMKPEYLFREED